MISLQAVVNSTGLKSHIFNSCLVINLEELVIIHKAMQRNYGNMCCSALKLVASSESQTV